MNDLALTVQRLFEAYESDPIAACTALHVVADRLVPPGHACKKGCSHCCHGEVPVTPLEVMYVVRHVLPERRTALLERCVSLLTHDERVCPFLEPSGECGCYTCRPAVCRCHVSPNGDCTTERQSVWHGPCEAGRLLVDLVLIRTGGERLEMRKAVVIALKPVTEARWKRHENPFRGAVL